VRVATSIELPCPPAEAWDALTRWARQADWMRDADRVEVLSEHEVGVGVRLAVRTRLFQVPAFTETMEVVTWDPPRRLELVHGPPVRGRGTWTLEPIAGGTAFTWIEDVELGVAFLGEAAAFLYAPLARRLMAGSQRRLKALLVSSGPARD
jgi:uncharacterized protein YndB with AHSA1/START domain